MFLVADFRSNCPTFKQCLQELKKWSDSHKDHFPVFITMNAKDEVIERPGFTTPEKFTSSVFDLLDQTILENLGKENVIMPDEVRGHYPSLENAVLAGNWPAIKNAKGKFIFILDETGDKTPEAAILIRNNPKKEAIATFVAKGYMVRTRADADTYEARINDRSVFEAACKSGAQIITTDYYSKSTFFASDYVIHFDGGGYIRRNPVLGK